MRLRRAGELYRRVLSVRIGGQGIWHGTYARSPPCVGRPEGRRGDRRSLAVLVRSFSAFRVVAAEPDPRLVDSSVDKVAVVPTTVWPQRVALVAVGRVGDVVRLCVRH